MKYESKQPNALGHVEYNSIEESTWQTLFHRQNSVLEGRACKEFIHGLNLLKLTDKIPQHFEVSEVMRSHTGWALEPVPAVIPAAEFFHLLATKRFPSANFIRTPEELDYLQEPDIFHEIYGHCPLLTNQNYADFVQEYGKLALSVSGKERMRLFRLFWFTIEFGLLKENNNLRIYGGGILSSYKETLEALTDSNDKMELHSVLDPLRTPFRIDIVQPVYFVIESLEKLFSLIEQNLSDKVKESMTLTDYPPKFPPKINAQHDEEAAYGKS
jgi:phenylalanine-4-hydroxylase